MSPVKCLCRSQQRYYSAHCPDRHGHARFQVASAYVDPTDAAAAVYAAQVLADAGPAPDAPEPAAVHGQPVAPAGRVRIWNCDCVPGKVGLGPRHVVQGGDLRDVVMIEPPAVRRRQVRCETAVEGADGTWSCSCEPGPGLGPWHEVVFVPPGSRDGAWRPGESVVMRADGPPPEPAAAQPCLSARRIAVEPSELLVKASGPSAAGAGAQAPTEPLEPAGSVGAPFVVAADDLPPRCTAKPFMVRAGARARAVRGRPVPGQPVVTVLELAAPDGRWRALWSGPSDCLTPGSSAPAAFVEARLKAGDGAEVSIGLAELRRLVESLAAEQM